MNNQEVQEMAKEVILNRAYDVDLEEINSIGFQYLGVNVPLEDAQKVQLMINRALVRVTFPGRV